MIFQCPGPVVFSKSFISIFFCPFTGYVHIQYSTVYRNYHVVPSVSQDVFKCHELYRIRIRDPCFLTSGSRIGFFRIPDLASPTHISESLVTVFWVRSTKFFCQLAQITQTQTNISPLLFCCCCRIRDPESRMEKSCLPRQAAHHPCSRSSSAPLPHLKILPDPALSPFGRGNSRI
jgi:hypothetical protein